MNTFKKYLPLFLLILLSATTWIFGVQHYFTFEVLKENQLALEELILLYPISSIAIYMAVYCAGVSFSLPIAAFMTILGGFLFGQIVGTCAVIISATAGATILFISAKMASKDFLAKKAGPWIKKMQKGFQENALSYLLTLRLIPIFPFVAVNLVAALLQIPLRTFILATFFGTIPGSFVYVSIGNALKAVLQTTAFSPKIVLEPRILLALTGLGILSLLPVLYKYLHKSKTL